MPSICHICGRTSGTCATCMPFAPDTVRREDGFAAAEQPMIRREDPPIAPIGAAAPAPDIDQRPSAKQ